MNEQPAEEGRRGNVNDAAAAAAVPSPDDPLPLAIETLEASVHLLLALRGVYPPHSFSRHRLHGTPVRRCRHPGVVRYVSTALCAASAWHRRGRLRKLVLAITTRSGVNASTTTNTTAAATTTTAAAAAAATDNNKDSITADDADVNLDPTTNKDGGDGGKSGKSGVGAGQVRKGNGPWRAVERYVFRLAKRTGGNGAVSRTHAERAAALGGMLRSVCSADLRMRQVDEAAHRSFRLVAYVSSSSSSSSSVSQSARGNNGCVDGSDESDSDDDGDDNYYDDDDDDDDVGFQERDVAGGQGTSADAEAVLGPAAEGWALAGREVEFSGADAAQPEIRLSYVSNLGPLELSLHAFEDAEDQQ